MATENLDMDYSKYDFKDSTEMYVHLSKKGLTKDTVREISQMKEEPEWMLNFRLRSYDIFMKKPMPQWGGDLNKIDFQNFYYYAKASEKLRKIGMTFQTMLKIHLINLAFRKQRKNSLRELVHSMNQRLCIIIYEMIWQSRGFYS